MQSGAYTYESLTSDLENIRLLKIHYCAEPTDLIPLTLKIVNPKDSHISYQALSYTWGPPTPHRFVLLNDRIFQVHQNLYDFLTTASKDEKFCDSEWLWIDQICIDQKNLIEKARQVARMAEIYESATGVHVWLGDGFAGGDELIHYINLSPSNASIQLRPHLLDYWNQLVQLPYWSRLWIVQEVILAKVITLWLGQARVVWGQFQHHADENELLYTIRKYPGAELGAGRLQQLVDQRNRVKHGENRRGLDWRQALAVQKGSKCLVRHDKIYGLLGLVRENLQVVPEYSLTVEDLYYQVLGAHLNDALSRVSDLGKKPALNVIAWFAKELRFELDLVSSVSDMAIADYLTQRLLQEHSHRRMQNKRYGILRNRWVALRIRRWAKTIPSIVHNGNFDWNQYNEGHRADELAVYLVNGDPRFFSSTV